MASIPPPSPARTMRPPEGRFTLTAEGGGYVLACECMWLRFFPARVEVDPGAREHIARCKGKREKKQDVPKRASSSRGWADRKGGASWIDRL